MNERIKELAEQAGAEFWQRLENDIVKENAYITFDPPESLQKFAELIVRECEKVSLKSSHRDDDMGAIIARQIKQYFGVEE